MSLNSAYIDGFFGDNGKGNVLSAILPQAVRLASPTLGEREEKPILVYSGIGGNNAANTYFIEGQKYVLRQLPGGLLVPQTFSQMGEEKYLRPRELKTEIEGLQARGIAVSPETLGIAPNAHITLDHYIQEDQKNLHTRGEHCSTGNGILQTAREKYARKGLRFIEFLDNKLMAEILQETIFNDSFDPFRVQKAKEMAESYAAEREFLSPFVKQDHLVFKEQGYQYKLAVNAHGAGLDINSGLYPGVTSSHPAKVPRWVDTIFGIFKLYVSSVGGRDRAFVSRMPEELEQKLVDLWGERGTGTGRARKLGWFDAVMARYSIDAAGIGYLIGTCGDRMSDLHQLNVKPEIVVAYEIDGKKYGQWQESFHRRDILRKAKPITKQFESWKSFTEADGKTITENAQKYLNALESELSRPFIMLMNGSRGEQDAIIKTHPLERGLYY